MKSILKLTTALALLLLAFSTTNAQMRDDSSTQQIQFNAAAVNNTPEHDYVFMKDGEMMINMYDKDLALGATYLCADGTKVGTDGTIWSKDGAQTKLQNGDKVYPDGHKEQGSDK